MLDYALVTGLVHIRYAVTLHMLQNSGLVSACLQQSKHPLHSIFVVCVNDVILLEGSKVECFLSEVALEVWILLVQLPELFLDQLHVLGIFKVDVYVLFILISSLISSILGLPLVDVAPLTTLRSVGQLVFLVLVVIDDLC